MPVIAFAIPRKKGKEVTAKQLTEELIGGKGDSLHARRVSQGFKRIRVWEQDLPEAISTVYLEADDLNAAIAQMAADQKRTRPVVRRHGRVSQRPSPPQVGHPAVFAARHRLASREGALRHPPRLTPNGQRAARRDHSPGGVGGNRSRPYPPVLSPTERSAAPPPPPPLPAGEPARACSSRR